jgi:peptidoglycan/LPS O-acetylase OafA/YrhL
MTDTTTEIVTVEVPAPRPERQGFPCLDGLRAIAALSVVVYHVVVNYNLWTLSFDTWSWLSRLGSFGVSVFFLISGLLLYRPFVVAWFDGRPPPNLRQFWTRRFFRIFPAYWAALIVFAFVFGRMTFRDATDVYTAFGLLQNYRAGYPLFGLGVEWTLVIEVSFYLALPGLAFLLRRTTRPDASPERKLRAQLVGLAAMFAFAVVLRYWSLWILDATPGGRGSWFPIAQVGYWLISYLDWFALGMLLAVGSAWVARGGRLPWPVAALARAPWASWLLAAELFWVAVQLHAPQDVFISAQNRVQSFGISLVFGFVAFFVILPAVFGPQDAGLIRKGLASRVMVALGTISYGIYLWHLIWLREVKGWTRSGTLPLDIWVWFAVTVALTIVTATISWFALERPLIRLSRRPRLFRR